MKNMLSGIAWSLSVIGLFYSSAALSQEKGTYTVQVAAKTDQRIAADEVSQLKTKGLDAFSTTLQDPAKGTFYRVNVGHLPSKVEAQKLKQKLVSQYHLPADSFIRPLDDESKEKTPEKITEKSAQKKEDDEIESDGDSVAVIPSSPAHAAIVPVLPPSRNVDPDEEIALRPAAKSDVPPVNASNEPQLKEDENDVRAALAPPPPTPPATEPAPAPVAAAAKSAPAPVSTPAPSPTTAPAASSTSDSERGFFSLTMGGLVDSTNYSLKYPTNFGSGTSLTSTSNITAGFAVLPTFRLSNLLDLQTGFMMFQRSYSVSYVTSVTTGAGAESYTAMEVPLLLFFNLSRNFALGIGGYAISNPSGSINQTSYGGNLPDAGLTGNDWGLTAALNFSVGLGAQSDLLLSARYNYGAGNMASAGDSPIQVFSDYQVMAGIKFYIIK